MKIYFSLFFVYFFVICSQQNIHTLSVLNNIQDGFAKHVPHEDLVHQEKGSSENKWIFSLKYMHMSMNSLLMGSRHVTVDDVFKQGYSVSQTNMQVNTLLPQAVYAINNRLYVKIHTYYIFKLMRHLTQQHLRFNTRSSGFGDTFIKCNYAVFKKNHQELILTLGLGIPSGSIYKRYNTPSGNQVLPYPMQLGSGTFDPLFDLQYSIKLKKWLLGIKGNTILHLYKNRNDYSFGNEYRVNTWIERAWNVYLKNFLVLEGVFWGNIRGADPSLNPNIVPLANPDTQGGRQINVFIGMNLMGQKKIFKGQKIELGAGTPIYLYLKGPQLRMSWAIYAQWSIAI